ncbi:hypothetical protein SLE2022_039130 [Rubroshorea leprosula]
MASSSNKDDSSYLYAMFLDLKERILETGQKIEKFVQAPFNDNSIGEADLNVGTVSLRTKFEDLNARLQEFAKQFCPSGLQNLDPLVLEMELGRSLSELGKDNQEAFLQGIQHYKNELKELDVKASSDFVELDDFPELVAVPLNAVVVSDGSVADSASSVAVPGSAEEHGQSMMMNLKALLKEEIKEMQPIGATKSDTNSSGNDQNWSGSNVMIRLYGFSPEEAEQKEINIAIESKIDKPNLDSRLLFCSSESGILNWRGLEILKSVIPTNEGEHLKNLRDRILQLETAIYDLVLYLHSLMYGNEEASEKLQNLRNSLRELKQNMNGMVPTVVYRILFLLEMQPRVEGSSGSSSGNGIGALQAALYEKMDFNQMVDSIREMIMHLWGVLERSGIPTGKTITPDVLGECDKGWLEAEDELRKIEVRIKEAKWDVLRKRKSEDEVGSSSGISDKAKGKRVKMD